LQVTALRGAERRVLVPDRLSSDRWWFAVPVGATALRLTSALHVPMWTDAASLDPRPLGVSLLAIEINGRTLSLDSPLLAEGFYGCEGAGANIWRWTNGDALLKLPAGALTVVLETPDRFDFETQADAA
jgi:hypothetical protein